jgi:hypothetical protein
MVALIGKGIELVAEVNPETEVAVPDGRPETEVAVLDGSVGGDDG